MRTIYQILVSGFLAISALCASQTYAEHAGNKAALSSEDLLAGQVSDELETIVDENMGFSGLIFVDDGGAIAALGRGEAHEGRPHKTGDYWRWASVTKQLVAVLVQEVEAGRLDLGETLEPALPDRIGPA